MGTGSCPEEVIWPADAQLFEEDIVHGGVVVLAGVDQDDLGAARLQGIHNRFDLHVVRPGAGDADDQHGSASERLDVRAGQAVAAVEAVTCELADLLKVESVMVCE